MNADRPIRALIAEDEPILAAILVQTLQRLWPELEIAGTAPNGLAAVEQALALRPDILFLDIKMPGQTGLEAAEELAERWDGCAAFPGSGVRHRLRRLRAGRPSSSAAADYVLKPVSDERLRKHRRAPAGASRMHAMRAAAWRSWSSRCARCCPRPGRRSA
jgi:DNA-binding LytR/AlgR family response regulator